PEQLQTTLYEEGRIGMEKDLDTGFDGQAGIRIHRQSTQDHIGQVIGPGGGAADMGMAQEMGISPVGIKLHPLLPSVVTDLYAVTYDKRQGGGIRVHRDRHKNIAAVMGRYIHALHLGPGNSIHVYVEG